MMRQWPINQAARVLREGGVIAYATESVFGLGCDPFNPVAVHRLLQIKQRPESKGLILIAADVEQFSGLLAPLGEGPAELISQHWPGPTTLVLPVTDQVPDWISGQFETVAMRVSDHPQVQALCSRFGGPIVSTSANFSGHPPARSATQVQRSLGPVLDYVLPGEVGGLQNPTQIIDAVSGQLLRAG